MSVIGVYITSHLNALFRYTENNTHHICTDAIFVHVTATVQIYKITQRSLRTQE